VNPTIQADLTALTQALGQEQAAIAALQSAVNDVAGDQTDLAAAQAQLAVDQANQTAAGIGLSQANAVVQAAFAQLQTDLAAITPATPATVTPAVKPAVTPHK
jgi:poly-gamma-glutamate capsule biosynthesis protein CapA/YwtB (metallophosphatase superfamily)